MAHFLTAWKEGLRTTVSHHLKKLREAGLLESERRGTWVYYRVAPDVLAVMAQLLAPADT